MLSRVEHEKSFITLGPDIYLFIISVVDIMSKGPPPEMVPSAHEEHILWPFCGWRGPGCHKTNHCSE